MTHYRLRPPAQWRTMFALVLLLNLRLFPQSFTSSNLPIVLINTNGQTIVNEPKITADMRIIYNGEGKRNALTDTGSYYNGKIGIEIRGSSSQMFPKKQYGIETRDAQGNDLDVSLFGMPAEADWILSAQYNDKSLMRDVLTYGISNSMGRYASRTRYCEVMINGEYRGVYMLFEKIKRDKGRVNISKMEPEDTTGDALTGGYIIKIDKLDGSGNDGWNSTFAPQPGSPYKIYYQYHIPKPEDITPPQKAYIKKAVLTYEAILFSPGFADSLNGYAKYFDVPSMVDVFLINEFTRNVDGYRLSTFMYKDRDSKNPKFFFGPVWDFNHGFGNCDYYEASKIEGWQIDKQANDQSFHQNDMFQPPFWWKKVFDDPAFKAKAALRWQQLRAGVLARARINAYIDSVAAHINEAQQRNFVKWPILGTYVWPNAFVGATYASEVAYLKTWIMLRLDWMDNELVGRPLGFPAGNAAAPEGFSLEQNYPNPFNPATTIRFTIPVSGHVRLSVVDLLGRTMATVIDKPLDAGQHTVKVDASAIASGMYVYRLESGSSVLSRKMIIVK